MEKVLKGKSLSMTPPTHPGGQLDKEDSKIKNMGYFYMFREKVINHYNF